MDFNLKASVGKAFDVAGAHPPLKLSDLGCYLIAFLVWSFFVFSRAFVFAVWSGRSFWFLDGRRNCVHGKIFSWAYFALLFLVNLACIVM